VDEWLSRLDTADDYLHRPSVQLGLGRYGVAELADILEPRARRGLVHDAVGRDQLERIADRAAGNAREAILTLHGAATVASERDRETIVEADIPPGHERGQRWGREAALSSLPLHHHVLYELIRHAGSISGERLHTWFDDIADDVYAGYPKTPICRRSRRIKLNKLDEYNLIESENNYRVLDAEVRSDLALPINDVLK